MKDIRIGIQKDNTAAPRRVAAVINHSTGCIIAAFPFFFFFFQEREREREAKANASWGVGGVPKKTPKGKAAKRFQHETTGSLLCRQHRR